MQIEIEINPVFNGRTATTVLQHVYGRSFFIFYSWLLFWSKILFDIIVFTYIAYGILFIQDFLANLSGFFLLLLLIIGLELPQLFKQVRNLILSKGETVAPLPDLFPGLNSGMMTVELTDTELGLIKPLTVEKIAWSAINTAFEKRKKIYLALGHNPIVVLPATDEIRAFLRGKGYQLKP